MSNPCDSLYDNRIRAAQPDEKGRLVFVAPEHPLASATGIVVVARHVASQAAGCWLTANQVVIHLDGDPSNCAPSNLRVFTRAELTRDFAFRRVRATLICANPKCKQPFDVLPSDADHRYCSPACGHEVTRRFNVDPAELAQMVWEMPVTEIAGFYGVSDKAIEKFCKKHGIQKPPRGYWAKVYAGRAVQRPGGA